VSDSGIIGQAYGRRIHAREVVAIDEAGDGLCWVRLTRFGDEWLLIRSDARDVSRAVRKLRQIPAAEQSDRFPGARSIRHRLPLPPRGDPDTIRGALRGSTACLPPNAPGGGTSDELGLDLDIAYPDASERCTYTAGVWHDAGEQVISGVMTCGDDGRQLRLRRAS